MRNFIKWSHIPHWGLAVFMVLLNCVASIAQEEPTLDPELTIVSQPDTISIATKDGVVNLSFVATKGESEITYQWYQSSDGTTENGVEIEGASESSYTTEPFSTKVIRYYYCVATVGEESVTSKIAAVAYTGLPILYVNTEVPIGKITKDAYVFGNMKLVYENGEEFTYEFKKEKDGEKKEGIKGRGNSSWNQPKKGYSIKFDSKQSFFGLPESKKWCIIANYSDKTLLRNKLASVLGNEIFNSDWNPTFKSVDVVWNGEYRGNYIFCERNVIGKGRIDIQDISDYGGKKYTDQNGDGEKNLYDGGFVLEIDSRKDAPFWFVTTIAKAPVTLKDPDEVSEDIQNHVQNVVQTAENILYSDDFTNSEQGWRKYFDENSAIDWYIINEIARNRDAKAFASIYKYYSPSEGKIHYGPIWDFDIGFGNDGENGGLTSQGITTGWYIKGGYWTQKMFTDSAFVANVKKRWEEKKDALNEMVSTGFQSLADANAVSAECNFKRWKILGKYVWPNPVGSEDRQTYQSEVDYIKQWLEERIAWLDNALKNSFFVSYNLEGGVLAKANAKVFISQSTSSFTLNNPTKEGYIFTGWSGTGINGLSKSVKVTDDKKGDKVFTANWIRDIAACDIVFAENTFIYKGSLITPDIIVSDGENILEKDVDYIVSYTDNIVVGTAKLTITGKGNYAGLQEKTFTISPKPVILNVASDSKTYGENDPAFDYSVEGLVSINNVTEVLTGVVLTRESGENAGEYAITATVDAAANPNYDVAINNGVLTINPDDTEITVAISGLLGTVTYDGSEKTVHGFSMTSNNDAYSLDLISYTGDSTALGTNAGSYPMGLSAKDFQNTSTNFTNVVFEVTDGNLVVEPKPISLTVTDVSKIYGEDDPTLDYSVEGLVSINDVTDELSGVVLTRESGEDAGEYAITATVDAAANPNYNVAINNGVLTINPDDTEITVAISGHSGTVTYDGSEKTVHGFSMTSNSEAYSLDLVSYTGDSTTLGLNAGTYPMGLSAKDFQNTSTNFTNVVFEVTDGNLVVQQKPILLTVADVSKSYGEDDPTLGYSVEGLVSINDVSDELSGVVLTRESGEDAGEYAITATVDADANPNYVISKNNGTFTITPKTTTYAAVKILEDQNGKRIELDGTYAGDGLISIPDPIEVNSVDFKRNLQAGIPSTVMLPISLPEGTTVNAKYYQIQNVGPNGKGGWKAIFTYIGDGNLPQANTPYAFILNEGENKLEFNLNGGVATVQTDEINNVDDESGNWYFKGTYAHKEWNQDDDELGRAYAFAGSNNEGGASKGQFGKIVDGAWANPMRAYLCKKDASLKPSAVLARSFAPGVSAVAGYSSMALPESIDIEFVDKIDNDEKVLATGRLNTRTGEFQILRKYDLKGRLLNGSPRARGAYYGKKTFKK